MTAEQSQEVIDRYFEAMAASGDFGQFYTDDVTCTTVDGDVEVRGRLAVQRYIVALHAQMSDSQTRRLVVSNGAAYLEGDWIDPRGTDSRLQFCVAYDLTDTQIAAMRCYGRFDAIITSL